MYGMKIWIYITCVISLASCEWLSQNNNVKKNAVTVKDTVAVVADSQAPAVDTAVATNETDANIHTGNTTPGELVAFAETQIGVPYVYASCDPKVGFDCSGFITYVFKHFNIQVPRSSYGFTHMGRTVPYTDAKKGDIILFTGTDKLATDVGHIGLVVSNNNGVLQFIHATSGKTMAVTVSPLDEQYKKRFVRISRVFQQNG
jgi:cell wall-associated NlpC family hydrolase